MTHDDPDTDAHYELYRDAAGEYRWRLRASNGRVIADSGEGYTHEGEAIAAIKRVRTHAAAVEVRNLDREASKASRLKRAGRRLREAFDRTPDGPETEAVDVNAETAADVGATEADTEAETETEADAEETGE